MNANTSLSATAGSNVETTAHDLFALTDEQILEIEPEAEGSVAPGFSPASPPLRLQGNGTASSVIPSERSESRDRGNIIESPSSQNPSRDSSASSRSSTGTPVGMTHGKAASENVAAEPPGWLAAQMKDPWSGEEAKELWNGVQQAKQEAAAYRAAFATPEDARALKELYPGGVNEARVAANRARLLDQIDGAYFGAAGKSAEETSAARAQLAQMMLHEDPAAFREMVFAGLRALEGANVAAAFRPPSEGAITANAQDGHLKVAATSPSTASTREAHVAAYAAFEKAANQDLERSVGAAIARTIEHALPAAQPLLAVRRNGETQAGVPALQERLSTAIRQDVEAALKGDRQLGEQIAQILSVRRFDSETRAQVVRLIGERAQQLVPVAAKRVLNDWTQTTLAAHRGNAARADAASARREVAPAVAQGASPAASPAAPARQNSSAGSDRNTTRPRVDYRKLSDEQILDL